MEAVKFARKDQSEDSFLIPVQKCVMSTAMASDVPLPTFEPNGRFS